MFEILLAIHIAVTVLIIVVVLLQHGKGADAGANFGGSNTNFSSKPPITFVTKLTMFLSAAFMINALAMAYVSKTNRGGGGNVNYESVISDEQSSSPVINDIQENTTDSINQIPNQTGKTTGGIEVENKDQTSNIPEPEPKK